MKQYAKHNILINNHTQDTSPYYQTKYNVKNNYYNRADDSKAEYYSDDYVTSEKQFDDFNKENCSKEFDNKESDCNLAKCGNVKDIIRNQANVSECEAKLFCVVTDRLCHEVKRAECLCELECIVNIANDFLKASAIKETAIGDVINSCSINLSNKGDCC